MVIDCSVSVAWCLPHEQLDFLMAIVRSIKEGTVKPYVPMVWVNEIHLVFSKKIRKSEVTNDQVTEHLRALGVLLLPTPCHRTSLASFTKDIFSLVRKHNPQMQREGVDFCDAFYLELAMKKQVPLACLDEKLAAAAREENVELAIKPEEMARWNAHKKVYEDAKRAEEAAKKAAQQGNHLG